MTTRDVPVAAPSLDDGFGASVARLAAGARAAGDVSAVYQLVLASVDSMRPPQGCNATACALARRDACAPGDATCGACSDGSDGARAPSNDACVDARDDCEPGACGLGCGLCGVGAACGADADCASGACADDGVCGDAVKSVACADRGKQVTVGDGYGRNASCPATDAACDVACECVDVRAGEALFMPAGTWHHVRAITPSFSVSYWWDGC